MDITAIGVNWRQTCQGVVVSALLLPGPAFPPRGSDGQLGEGVRCAVPLRRRHGVGVVPRYHIVVGAAIDEGVPQTVGIPLRQGRVAKGARETVEVKYKVLYAHHHFGGVDDVLAAGTTLCYYKPEIIVFAINVTVSEIAAHGLIQSGIASVTLKAMGMPLSLTHVVIKSVRNAIPTSCTVNRRRRRVITIVGCYGHSPDPKMSAVIYHARNIGRFRRTVLARWHVLVRHQDGSWCGRQGCK